MEAALIAEPDNEDLLNLRNDLNEVIQLQEELLGEDLAESAPKEKAPSNVAPTTSDKKITWKVGDRCLAPSKNNQLYIAMIDGISQDKVAITFASKYLISTIALITKI